MIQKMLLITAIIMSFLGLSGCGKSSASDTRKDGDPIRAISSIEITGENADSMKTQLTISLIESGNFVFREDGVKITGTISKESDDDKLFEKYNLRVTAIDYNGSSFASNVTTKQRHASFSSDAKMLNLAIQTERNLSRQLKIQNQIKDNLTTNIIGAEKTDSEKNTTNGNVQNKEVINKK